MAIVKSEEQRTNELGTALRALIYASNGFRDNGDEAHLLTAKAQIRALVATGGRDMEPLLLNLSDELNIPLYLYSLPPKPITPGLIGQIIPGKTWATKQHPGMKKYSLIEYLELELYYIDTTKDVKKECKY